MKNLKWDTTKYINNFSFVSKYGEDVTELIDAPSNSFVVDLGCGSGALCSELVDKRFRVLGIDASEDMLNAAAALYPDIDFMAADALDFKLDEPADVIFSNAVFHWIDSDRQDDLAENIASQLKTGGELVCEFGGKGCAAKVHKALSEVFAEHGREYESTFYFPTIGEYATLLERHGFRVEYATLFDRPTEQFGEDGLEEWIRMFIANSFAEVDAETAAAMIAETAERLRDELYVGGKWVVNYVRIRVKAIKM